MKLEDAETMAIGLMKEHGIYPEWSFRFDRSKSRHGQARNTVVRGRYMREITLSRYITEEASRALVEDTVNHEIAHVLVGLEQGHNAIWRAKAESLGCFAQGIEEENYKMTLKMSPYKYFCTEGCLVHYSKRPISIHQYICANHPHAKVNRLHNGREDITLGTV